MTVVRNGNCIWTRDVKGQDYKMFQLMPFFFFLKMVFLVFVFMMLAANQFPVGIWIRVNRSEPFGHSDTLGNPCYWCREFLSWYQTEMWTYCTGFCFISLCRRKNLKLVGFWDMKRGICNISGGVGELYLICIWKLEYFQMCVENYKMSSKVLQN